MVRTPPHPVPPHPVSCCALGHGPGRAHKQAAGARVQCSSACSYTGVRALCASAPRCVQLYDPGVECDRQRALCTAAAFDPARACATGQLLDSREPGTRGECRCGGWGGAARGKAGRGRAQGGAAGVGVSGRWDRRQGARGRGAPAGLPATSPRGRGQSWAPAHGRRGAGGGGCRRGAQSRGPRAGARWRRACGCRPPVTPATRRRPRGSPAVAAAANHRACLAVQCKSREAKKRVDSLSVRAHAGGWGVGGSRPRLPRVGASRGPAGGGGGRLRAPSDARATPC